MAATPRDNRVYIKTEPADEALRPQNARQSNSVLSMDMQLQWCDQQNTKIKTELDQYSNRGPLPSIETQNSSGGFSSNAGFVKTEPSELIVRRVDEMKTFEEEENIGLHDSCDVGVTEVKTEPDGELALKVEPDSSPYTSPQEDNVGLSSLADTGDWEGLKEELMSPPEPVPVRLLAAGSRGLLRIDVEDPLHPVESEIFKKEPEDMDMDQNSLDFDVAKVKHEPLSLSASASGISCEASTSGEDEGERKKIPKKKHGAHSLVFEENVESRRNKRWTRFNTLVRKSIELTSICGGAIFIKYVPISGKTSTYTNSDSLWSQYIGEGVSLGTEEPENRIETGEPDGEITTGETEILPRRKRKEATHPGAVTDAVQPTPTKRSRFNLSAASFNIEGVPTVSSTLDPSRPLPLQHDHQEPTTSNPRKEFKGTRRRIGIDA